MNWEESLKKLKWLVKTKKLSHNNPLWDKIPLKKLLLLSNEKSEQGNNFFHLVCSEGELHDIPSKYIDTNILTQPNKDGNTCFHILASRGKILDIPKNLLTKKYLRIENKTGMTSYHASTIFNLGYGDIPKELWEQQDIEKQELIKGKTPMHLAAKHNFRGIPKEMMTESNLLLEDYEGTTALHEGIRNGAVDAIPKEFLNPPNMLRKNNLGVSPIEENWLYTIPFEGQETDNPEITKMPDETQLKTIIKKVRNSSIKELYQKELKKLELKKTIGLKNAEQTLQIG